MRILKRLLVTLLILGTIVVLTSCGGTSAKSEKEICKDIMASDDSFDYGLKITLYNVEKRQTNEDEKTDYVWIDITAENEECVYYASYTLVYELYNEGWMLEKVDRTNRRYLPQVEVDQSEADALVAESYDSVKFVDKNITDTSALFAYTAEKTEGYVVISCSVWVEYSYSLKDGWKLKEIDDAAKDMKWDIVGEWYYKQDDDDININILSIDEDTVTFEYDIYCTAMGPFSNYCNAKTDEPITAEYSWAQRGNYVLDEPYSAVIDHSIYAPGGSFDGWGKSDIWVYGSGVCFLGARLTRK